MQSICSGVTTGATNSQKNVLLIHTGHDAEHQVVDQREHSTVYITTSKTRTAHTTAISTTNAATTASPRYGTQDGVRGCQAPHPQPAASMSQASMKSSGPVRTENVTDASSAKCPCHETGTRNPPNAASPNSASALDSMKLHPLEPGRMKSRPTNRR